VGHRRSASQTVFLGLEAAKKRPLARPVLKLTKLEQHGLAVTVFRSS